MHAAFLLALLAAAPAPPRAPAAPLTVHSWPDGVLFVVTTSDGQTRMGKTPARMRVPLGETRVLFGGAGFKPKEQTLDVQGPTRAEACVDPVDQVVECLTVFPVGPAPKAVLANEDGSQLWVTLLMGPQSVRLYETRSGAKLAEASLGRLGAVELERSLDGKLLWATQLDSGKVMELDGASRAITRTFDTRGVMPKVVRRSADGRSLFVANWFSNDVSEIDLETGKVRRLLETVKTPRGLHATPDGASLYVAGFGAGQLAKIDLATGKSRVVWSGGKALRHLVPDEERRRLYISDMGRSEIFVMDLDTDEVKPWAKTGHAPNTIVLSPDRRVLYVSNRGANGKDGYTRPGPEWGSVLLFDTETGALLDAIVGGNQCTGLDVSADGKVLAFSDFMDGRVRVYRIPPIEALRAGAGGRAESHRSSVVKRGAR
ncbi:MAG TPA: YncE family protein [Anaeromyxobacter sp.]|nr:YncE family protein [Anaeromyxobacter sp.]